MDQGAVHAALARFFAAIEAGDVATVESMYHADVRVWHSPTQRHSDKRHSVAILRWLMAPGVRRRYEIVERHVHDDRVYQRHVLHLEVDGFELATALNADVLTMISDATGGSYHAAGDPESLREATRSIDLRITLQDKLVELTAVFTIAGIVLLAVGALLMIRWYGRVV